MADQIPPLIPYKKTEINGVPVRPDSRDVILKAIAGSMIEVYSGNDYINLYHVFDRIATRDAKRYGHLRFLRKQIGPSTWRVFVATCQDDIPEQTHLPGYDPRRGRYKRFAQQLEQGEVVTLSNRVEAVKARRAWQLYVPRKDRVHLQSVIRRIPRTGKFMVMVIEHAGAAIYQQAQ